VAAAVDTKNHLIVAHEVTNVGTDRHHLSNMAEQARTEMGVETLDAVADRGYYRGEAILACEQALLSRCRRLIRPAGIRNPRAFMSAGGGWFLIFSHRPAIWLRP
jgi:hypothetical protein